MNTPKYPFEIRPLSEEEGGGWLITFPDLPGCMSDGETPEQAIQNGEDAVQCWLDACCEQGRDIPKPNEPSGKFIVRVPKSIHSRLIARAKQESVSMNMLAVSFLSEGLGKKQSQR